MTYRASPDFWALYRKLPVKVQLQADKAFELLKANPYHPSIHFKRLDRFWSARVSLHYRVLGIEVQDGILWFWIGTHAGYDALIK